jgi:23S rRNA pseudouridine1911/1915/1917 synthase
MKIAMTGPGHLTFRSDRAGLTLAAVLRGKFPGRSWSDVKRLIDTRRVLLNGEACRDSARRVEEGDRVEVLARPVSSAARPDSVKIRHLDEHLVVVEKPSGIPTVRHPAERTWSLRRKALHPTLEDMVPRLIAEREHRRRKGPPPRLRVVHRLDKETSGLVVFARTVAAERGLGKQFHAHSVARRYLAVIPGYLPPQRIATRLVRDRGDRRRGSTALPGVGKEAVTHIDVAERLRGYTLLWCRLETGRTHQIRIHLAEKGHPVCGEKVYNRDARGNVRPDQSGAPRLALHATELGFLHPVSGERLSWEMPLAADLTAFLQTIRRRA